MKKIRVVLTACLLFLCSAVRAQDDSGWQTSSGLAVRLDIRNKFADKPFQVKWQIAFGKQTYTLTKAVNPDEPDSFVVYPNDFNGGTQDGKYFWKATVNNKPILSGWFTYASVGTPDRLGFRDRQVTFHQN